MRKIEARFLLISLIMLGMLAIMPHVIAQTEEMFEFSHDENSEIEPYSNTWHAQTFTPQTSHDLTKIILHGKKYGNPTDFIVSIKETNIDGLPTGDDLVSKSILASSIPTEFGEITIVFDTQISLTAGTKYAIVFRCPDGDGLNKPSIQFYDLSAYPRGDWAESADSGATWTIDGVADFWFEEWGYAPATPSMGNTLFPFLPILGLALGISFVTLFFMIIAYVSNKQLIIPYEMIFIPLFCVISVCVSLLIIVIFGL